MDSDWGDIGRSPMSSRPASAASYWSEPVRHAEPGDALDTADDFFGLRLKRVRAAVMLAHIKEEEREGRDKEMTVRRGMPRGLAPL